MRDDDRSGRAEVTAAHSGEPVEPEEPETDPDLLLEQLQRADQTGGARGREPAAGQATEAHRLGSQRDRLHDVAHSTEDDPTKCRSDAEREAWEAKEPLPRLRRYLGQKGLVDERVHADLTAEVEAEVREAIERAEARMRTEPLDFFERVYAEPPAELEAQRAELARQLAPPEGPAAPRS